MRPAWRARGEPGVADDNALVRTYIVEKTVECLDILDADTALITPAFHSDVDLVRPHQTGDPDIDLAVDPAAPSYDLVVMNNVAVRV